MVLLGIKKILSANLIEKIFLSLKWAETNILLALCALKNIIFVEKKIMSRQVVAALRSEKTTAH